ncbi:spectraplakin [Loa loa]|uniref:Spectraplakin n=1 Tax=Loa loa TaxID=7209 RepID=A0A1S0UB48_LOALO|nr:spectraplakin [Loa loa]EFO27979.2 spectraplakin [Loa loa]
MMFTSLHLPLLTEDLHNECTERQLKISEILNAFGTISTTISEGFWLVTSSEDTSSIFDRMQEMRTELMTYASKVQESIGEADRLCAEGAEFLTPDQFHSLKEHRNKLETNYNQLLQHTDVILPRLNALTKLLLEFSNESSLLHSFLNEKARELTIIRAESGDPQVLQGSRQKVKGILDEVITAKERLRDICALSVRIQSEIDGYVIEMRLQYPSAQFPSIDAHELTGTISRLQADYDILLRNCHELSAYLSQLKSLATAYTQNAETLNESITNLEREISETESILRNTDTIDDGSLMSQLLSELETLQHASFEQTGKIETVMRSALDLSNALAGTDAHERISSENQRYIDELARRQIRAQKRIEENIDSWRSKLTKTNGIREGMMNVMSWLDEENKRYSEPVSLPLYVDKLIELRHQNELRQREISSRQKVLIELQADAQKIAAANPDSVASRQILSDCSDAQRKFATLFAISKVYANNITELCTALTDFNDLEASINKKLLLLNEKQSNASLTDINGLSEISNELKQLAQGEWKEMESKCKWILTVPNVIEDNCLEKNVSHIDNTIRKCISRIEELISRGHEIGKLCQTSNELKNKLSANLEDLETRARVLEECSLNPVDLAKQRSTCQQLQTECQHCRSEFETLSDTVSKLVEIETIASMKMKGCVGQSKQVQEALREMSSLQQRYSSLGCFLQLKNEKIIRDIEKLSDWDLQRDSLARWISNENKRLNTDCPVTLVNDVVRTNIAKAKRLEEVLVIEKQLEMEEIRSKARLLTSEPSIPGTSDIINSQKALETDWGKLNQAAKTLKEWNESVTSLDKWLTQKERMISVIGTINIDPKVIDNQLIQIKLLRGELEDHGAARNKVNELAHNLVARSATPVSAQQIVMEMDTLNRRWISFHDELEKKKVTLQKVKELGSKFSIKQRDVKMQLISVAEAIEQISRSPLTSKNDVDDQLKILNASSTRSSEINSQLEELKELVNLICEISQDHSLQTDVREQLNTTVQTAQELNKKIESMKVAAANAKDEEGQTMMEAEAAVKWVKDMQEQLSDLGPLSVNSIELDEQRAAIEKIYGAVLDMEGGITLIRAKLMDQIKKAPNSKQKTTLDILSAVWNPLLEKIKTKHANAERAFDLVNQLDTLLKSLTMQDNDITELAAMKQEIGKHELELAMLETLLSKLEVITTGPSLKKLGREVENVTGDLRTLLKDIKNVWQKVQISKDIQKQFSRRREEAQSLLDAAKETAESLKRDDNIPSITREVLLKTVNDLENSWHKKERELLAALKDIEGIVTREEAENLHEDVRKMGDEYVQVVMIIQGLHCNMKMRDEMLDAVKQKISLLTSEIRSINKDSLSPIERNIVALEQQNRACDELLKSTAEKEKVLDELALEWQQLWSTTITQTTQKNAVMQQINEIREDLNKQRAAITQRKRVIGNMLLAVQEFVCKAEALRDEIEKLATDNTLKEPVQTELNLLRTQQEKLRIFLDKLRPTNQNYAAVLESYDKLIKSADEGVSTTTLEEEKNKLTSVWNSLNKQIADREQQVCVSLQELGSYTDAHNALLVWLQDTEESLQNQRPPSIEYKVVKEQTRANDILLKHIEEKQQSIDGFKTLIDKVVGLITDVTKREILKEQSNNITQRSTTIQCFQLKLICPNILQNKQAILKCLIYVYELKSISVLRYVALVGNAQDRRSYLHDAIVLTKDWAQLSGPFKTWLETTERALQELGQVPTDEEKFQQQINSHQKLQENIEMKHTDVEKMMQICPLLTALASDEEAIELETLFKSYMIRYENLGTRAAECGVLLQQIGEEITNFLQRTHMLADWLDKIENDMDKLDTVSVYPEELREQSALLADLAMEIANQESLISTVVEDGHELCRQTTGDEAIALQNRVETLRTRYLDLTALTDAKIAILSEALPLSEKFHDDCDIVQQWMDAVEQDLQTVDQTPIETQATILAQMEDDLAKWRSDIEEISDISKQLQNLVPFKVHGLEIQNDDLTRRFNHLAEQITRKGDKLMSVEKQSRQVLDELDFLNEWFADAHERLSQSAAPEVDPDYVKKQLKNQKQMNEDITVMKARLRDTVADAHRVVRVLGGEASGQDLLIESKIETGRNLSANVAQLGGERLAKLEQALALCLEIDQSFGELHSWLESMENEIENCPPVTTGHQRDQLMQQQAHNTKLQHSIISHKSLMDRFHKNVSALSQLCGSEDEVQLQKIAEGLDERFFAARDTIRQRAEALETAIEQSSQFTDRLDVVLANLDGAAMQIRNPEPIQSDPERIKSQIIDNLSLMEQLKHKEGVLRSVKENAYEILMHAKPSDTGAAEISIKIKELESLWEELMKDVTTRKNLLEDTLAKAERFWCELNSYQKAINELRLRIEGIQPALGDPTTIEQQQNILLAIKNEMQQIKPEIMGKLRCAGHDLCGVIAEEEKAHIEQQMNEVEGGWVTVTDMCDRKESDLVEAMNKAVGFRDLLTKLINWIAETEAEIFKLNLGAGASSSDIGNEFTALGDLRSLLDEKALEKEQLNQLYANLCVGSNAQQSANIRASVNDLNTQWNKLYTLLNERQQKVEKALLEMGQFSQAYEQLMIWIEKTEHILNEINSRPVTIKEVEVEVCKHRVIQNEILAHETSVDTLNSAAKRIIAVDSNTASSTQAMIDKLNSNWHMLVDKLEDVWVQLDDARKAAENLGGEVDRWAMWLQDKDADLSHMKPTGGLPETAQAQLDNFFVLKAEIEQNRSALEAHLEAATKYLSESDRDSWIAQREAQLMKKWVQMQNKIGDKEQKLRIALTEAEQLHSSMTSMKNWLNSAENYLGCLEHVSRIPDTVEEQINEHTKFQAEVSHYRELMSDLNSKGTKLQYYCEKKDAIPIKNLLVSAKHRFEKVASRCADRMKLLDLALQEARFYFESHAEVIDWITSRLQWISDQYAQTASCDRLRSDLDKHRKFQHELTKQQTVYEATYKRGKVLSEHAPRKEQAGIDLMNELLKERWTQLVNATLQKQRSIEDALLACGQFDEALSSLREWLEKSLPNLQNMETISVYGDLETVNKLCDKHNELKEQIDAHRDTLNSVKERAQQMLRKEMDDSLGGLKEKVEKVSEDWVLLEELARRREEKLKISYDIAKNFNYEIHEFLDFLPKIEARLRTKSQMAEGENEILEQMDEVAQLHKEMDDKKPLIQSIKKAGEDIQSKCHPSAEQPMKYWLKVLENRWDEVTNAIDSKRDDLAMQLSELRGREKMIVDLLEYIEERSTELKVLNETSLPYEISALNRLTENHEHFEKTLREKQALIDEATRSRRKMLAVEEKVKKKSGKALQRHEHRIRHPKSDQLSSRWKKLWIDSMDYGRQLREMKDYLEEVKRLESFSFEEWRERYLEWTDSGKARISDLFRRIDKSGTGRVPRAAFIDGIIASKFPTTRLEMEKVANEFDKGDRMIDSKEFMAKLRSDFSKKLPMKQKTDSEKITEEVVRQTERCNCINRYKIQKVGDGHYRFGETQIKRMVRILRSTVMVRVGGGWVALEEFLHKHDPCRAKGRTNLDLQRNFYDDIRPKDAYDTMETFTKSARSTPSRDSPIRSFQESLLQSRFQATPGPITKIREKTERSMPMYVTGRSSTIYRNPLLDTSKSNRKSSDMNGQDPKIWRPNASGTLSLLGSHGDMLDLSRPVSQSSDVSVEGDRPTRIPSLRSRKGVNCRASPAQTSPQPRT